MTYLDVCKSLSFLLDNIYVRFGEGVYRQVICTHMGTNCAPLVADLFLYCYGSHFMLSLKSDTQSDIIEAFNNTSRYLEDSFNVDNPFFDTLFPFIYPKELRLNKTNESDFSATFLDLGLSMNKFW